MKEVLGMILGITIIMPLISCNQICDPENGLKCPEDSCCKQSECDSLNESKNTNYKCCELGEGGITCSTCTKCSKLLRI